LRGQRRPSFGAWAPRRTGFPFHPPREKNSADTCLVTSIARCFCERCSAQIPSNQGAVGTAKDFAAIRRLVKTGATGKTIAEAIGRSVVALYQKASIDGISLSAVPALRRSVVAKKAKAVAASNMRRSR
jgi:hypothetical protein